MKCKIDIEPLKLHFKQPAATSRCIYNTRKIWLIHFTADKYPEREGIGECAPLPHLSREATPDYEKTLRFFCDKVEANDGQIPFEELREYPSMLFGLETAIRHYNAGNFILWNTPFSRSEKGIQINGLIWMGDSQTMLRQIEQKIKAGFHCIKLKIGAIDFEEEIRLLQHVRRHFTAEEIELRVDANGAFLFNGALDKLKRLAELNIHSIEQPIKAGNWRDMARLAACSPLPIALDEELIDCRTFYSKQMLLSEVRPQYIVIKPSLHGGITGCEEWISLAQRYGIKWWITSALESNIGLNAIAQWCSTFKNTMPQGLGTGQLFTDNIEMPLEIRKDKLWFGKS